MQDQDIIQVNNPFTWQNLVGLFIGVLIGIGIGLYYAIGYCLY